MFSVIAYLLYKVSQWGKNNKPIIYLIKFGKLHCKPLSVDTKKRLNGKLSFNLLNCISHAKMMTRKNTVRYVLTEKYKVADGKLGIFVAPTLVRLFGILILVITPIYISERTKFTPNITLATIYY